MARRRDARPLAPNVTRLPGFEEPLPPIDVAPVEGSIAEPNPNPNPISTGSPKEPTPGLTLVERQSRWLKERARFEASLEATSANRE
jgi:hypothetical protein